MRSNTNVNIIFITPWENPLKSSQPISLGRRYTLCGLVGLVSLQSETQQAVRGFATRSFIGRCVQEEERAYSVC